MSIFLGILSDARRTTSCLDYLVPDLNNLWTCRFHTEISAASLYHRPQLFRESIRSMYQKEDQRNANFLWVSYPWEVGCSERDKNEQSQCGIPDVKTQQLSLLLVSCEREGLLFVTLAHW